MTVCCSEPGMRSSVAAYDSHPWYNKACSWCCICRLRILSSTLKIVPSAALGTCSVPLWTQITAPACLIESFAGIDPSQHTSPSSGLSMLRVPRFRFGGMASACLTLREIPRCGYRDRPRRFVHSCAAASLGYPIFCSEKRLSTRTFQARHCVRLRVVSEVLGCAAVGAWRSLVAHLLWEQRVAGSNPAAPTKLM